MKAVVPILDMIPALTLAWLAAPPPRTPRLLAEQEDLARFLVTGETSRREIHAVEVPVG